MRPLYRLRLYHTALAVLTTAAYLSGEFGGVHRWLGYAVLAVIIVRIGLAFTGAAQLGLMRFYPSFTGLRLGNLATHPAISRTLLAGIAVCLIGAVTTGIVMDRGRTLGFAGAQTTGTASVAESDDNDDDDAGGANVQSDREGSEDFVEELHEAVSNILLVLVAIHVAYLFTFKRPIARFMLFNVRPDASDRGP